MIGVLLFILKLILFILLFLVGFLLSVLLLILLLPIKYEAYGHKYESLRLKAKVFWLFRLLMVHVTISDSDVDIVIKVCGFKIGNKHSADQTDALSEAHTKKQAVKQEVKQAVKQETKQEVKQAVKQETKQEVKQAVKQETKQEAKQETKQEAKQAAKQEKRKIKEPKKPRVKKEKEKKHKTKQEKKESGFQKFKELYAFMTSEEQAGVLKFVLKRVKKIIVSILPKKIKLYVHFGLDDPATTGQILATVSVFYPLYGQSVRLVPNFIQPVFEGEGYIKGRIIIGYILYQGLRVYFDKRIKAIIKKFKNA